MMFVLLLASELSLKHRMVPVYLYHFHSIHLFCLVEFVCLSLSISLASRPASFIETVKVKTNPIDQPAHRQMDMGSNYWWMDDGRWMTAGKGAERFGEAY